MKTRTYVSILILVLAVMFIFGSCATKKIAITDEDLSNFYSTLPCFRPSSAKKIRVGYRNEHFLAFMRVLWLTG